MNRAHLTNSEPMSRRRIHRRELGSLLCALRSDPMVFHRWMWARARLGYSVERILDAGSGTGAFTLLASARAGEVVAINNDAEENVKLQQRAARWRADNATIANADLREVGLISDGLGLFDKILCLETIEHVIDDVGLVRELALLLKPEGELLLSTPDEAHRRLFGEVTVAVETGEHVRYGYNHRSLAAVLEAAGLQIVDAGGVSGIVSQRLCNVLWRLQRRLGYRQAWLLTLPLRPAAIFDSMLSRMLRYPYYSLAVVARHRS